MRPQPEGCGEPPVTPVTNTPTKTLQCGHSPKAVENQTQRPHHSPCLLGFNAATARRLWRTESCIRVASKRHGFNAATARRLWRTSTPGVIYDCFDELQCGHSPKAVENHDGRGYSRREVPSFNAATARRLWRTHDWPPMCNRNISLQCGHSPKAVENVRQRIKIGRCPAASMRPQPEGCGEPNHDYQRHGQHAASMRPQPEGCGEQRNLSQRGNQGRELQCGHSPKAVENQTTATQSGGATIPLQCGHARRLWRTGQRLIAGTPIRRALQCGHSPKAVENTTHDPPI